MKVGEVKEEGLVRQIPKVAIVTRFWKPECCTGSIVKESVSCNHDLIVALPLVFEVLLTILNICFTLHGLKS